MSEHTDLGRAEEKEIPSSGLLLSVEPLAGQSSAMLTDTDRQDKSGLGGDTDGKDSSDADGTDAGSDTDGTDNVGADTDGTDSARDADGTDS